MAYSPALESEATVGDLVTIGTEWACDKQGEEAIVAATMQVLLALYPRVVEVVKETNLQPYATSLLEPVSALREVYTDTDAFCRLARAAPAAMSLVHYTRNSSTIKRIVELAHPLAEELEKRGEANIGVEGMTRERRVGLCEKVIATVAGAWLVLDQALIRSETRERAQELEEALVAGVRVLVAKE